MIETPEGGKVLVSSASAQPTGEVGVRLYFTGAP